MQWNELPYSQRQQLTQLVIARDGMKCAICHLPIKSMKEFSIEHKIKQRNGGTHELDNLAPAHKTCNYADVHEDILEGNVKIISEMDFFRLG